jgi:hypothetical protein
VPGAAVHRNEFGALLVAAGFGPNLEHALTSLPALNGLRVSEATGADNKGLRNPRSSELTPFSNHAMRRGVVGDVSCC